MGLDMYLRAKKYVSNYEFWPEEKELNKKLRESLGVDHISDDHASVEVAIGVGYWRKANQIHAWFVENVQKGEDNCHEYYVDREQLKELLDLCKETLETKNAELLPPQSGFFFGSTDIDEYYWSDIEHTIEMLESVLNDRALDKFDFQYQSSW